MSQENVEIVRRAVEAAARKPKQDYETMNALFHPDHEYISRLSLEAVEGGSVRGGQGYREWLKRTDETVKWESTVEEVTEIDEGRVLVIAPTHARGEQSGIELDQRLAAVVTVRGGKVIRTEVYRSREEALEAAGLSE